MGWGKERGSVICRREGKETTMGRESGWRVVKGGGG